MSDYVLFQMWQPFRQSLIDGHLFYVEQARMRLLSQFEDIEVEADKAVEEWLQRHRHRFDPARDDPESFYEGAHEAGLEFYELLNDMRDRTYLSVVAGMFHEWDKQLRDWLVSEFRHFPHRSDNVAAEIWAADFGQIADLLESFPWAFRSQGYFDKLDACRIVVNVYKHGKGKSLNDLKDKYPEYINNPLRGFSNSFAENMFGDYKDLKVNDEQFQEFADAIEAFWRDVPEEGCASETIKVPDWFAKGFLKKPARQAQGSKK